MNNKKKNETIHAKKRAKERYGIKLNHRVRTNIISSIQNGKSLWVKKLTNRITEHTLITEDGTKIRVLYDKYRHNIVTFLPMKEN
jgi:hypothetical protein